MLNWQQSCGLDQSHLVPVTDALGKQFLVHQNIVGDLTRLFSKAEKDGILISIVSAYRSFEHQLSIWNDKWQGHRPVFSRHGRPLAVSKMSDIEKYKAICLWSALPGMSRHHWGTDLDIFNASAINDGYKVELQPEEFYRGGPCESLNTWLHDNLEEFGFFRPYQQYQQGVAEEPWHISHKITAQQILDSFDYDACRQHLEKSDIKSAGFIGNQIEHYKDKYFRNIYKSTS
ncbi:M15 family metallopeptidase [Aliikangiella sp. G2MR2-5]|uniref:M15 family metallopeptidase n=1 Tax=Aliikangiella sp. G2MR2-5 TaxID=2788943 RepID=UPI0018AC5A53|nr:M15 family metallopeptidase [Aliikangiella sp. G2MR2-5]